MEKSTRRIRFEKVAGRRMTLLLRVLSNLAKTSNKNNYEYSDADVRKMFKTIKERVADVEQEFTGALNKTKGDEFKF